ncbi:hypothetical protein ACFRI7_33540 [Streptomyces sp. NPDC056716]|uniref:hypothetical protein n=1 Tax=unclassified Streptomyces TaxID=2593676 RepID=UPI0036991380
MASGLLLAGCTSGGDEPDPAADKQGGTQASPSPLPAASPSPGGVVDIDPAKVPRTAAQATALIRDIIAEPVAFGPGTERQSPYESDPRSRPVLRDDCVWEQRPLPDDILATLTRSYEIPAAGGDGPLRLSAVVTVHRTAEQADWENAEVLEEMMRCPEQRLRSDEMVGSLTDVPAALGDLGNGFADDSLTETGEYTNAQEGGAHPYVWRQTRIGQFTLAVSAKGAVGWSQAELLDRVRDPHIDMGAGLRAAVERHPSPAGPATPEPGTGTSQPSTSTGTGTKGDSEASGDTADTADTGDTGDTADTGDSADTTQDGTP